MSNLMDYLAAACLLAVTFASVTGAAAALKYLVGG